MGSRAKTTTRKIALKKVRENLDRLPTRQANIIRMRHGLALRLDEPVGDPPEDCSEETIRNVRAIEEEVLERARGKQPYSRPDAVKKKIVRALKKKS